MREQRAFCEEELGYRRGVVENDTHLEHHCDFSLDCTSAGTALCPGYYSKVCETERLYKPKDRVRGAR